MPDAIMKNKEAILTLEKRQQFIEKKIELQIADAKEKARLKNKQGALMALKRKKMLEGELENLSTYFWNLFFSKMFFRDSLITGITKTNFEMFSNLQKY